MNYARIAAGLRLLAEAFDGGEEGEVKVPRGKAPKAPQSAAAPAAAASAQAAPATAAAAPAQAPAETAAPAAPLSRVTLEQLNKLVLKVAASNRDAAVAALGRLGAKTKEGHPTTVGLAQEKWDALYDALEEEQAKIDAAAAQVAQASLV
jgi:hypothetical protein